MSCSNKRGFIVLLVAFAGAGIVTAQTFSNVDSAADLDYHSVRITGNMSQNGWIQIKYGTVSGGPYPNQSASYCTASPEIVFTGGGGSGAEAWVQQVSSGAVFGPAVSYTGSGYTSAPTVSFVDRCIPQGGTAGSGATATATVSGGKVTAVSMTSNGSGYHSIGGGDGFVAVSAAYKFSISIGGLIAGTKYYFVITERPDQNDSTGLVTSSEFNFTTLASAVSPVLPTPPQIVYNPTASYPSFSTGYTVVPMASSGGDCVAKSNVGPVAYGSGSWSVTAGDGVQAVLNEVGYGAILEFDQSTVCKLPSSAAYLWPVKAVDPTASSINDPAHRWIVMRTKQVSSSDFPPVGFRTSPAWAAKLANLQSQTPNGNGYNHVQVIMTDNGAGTPHHYWIYNMEVSTNGPGHWGSFMLWGFNGNGFNNATPPVYLVADRIYFNGPVRTSATTMQDGIAGIPGGHEVITNNYFAGMDSDNPLPQVIFFTDCGQGPFFIDNNEMITGGGQTLYVESNSGLYCNNGQPVSATTQNNIRSYDDGTITHNSFWWPKSALNSNANWDHLTRPLSRQQVEFKIGRRINLSGNIINGDWCGQTAGAAVFFSSDNNASVAPAETGEADLSVTLNELLNVAYPLQVDGTKGIGQSGPPDNGLNRHVLYTNNLSYNLGKNIWRDTNFCGGLGPGYFNLTGGPQDVTITNNTLSNVSGDEGNSSAWFYPTWLQTGGGVSLTAGFTFQRNILYMSGGGVAIYGILPDNSKGCVANSDCSNFPASPLVDTSTQPTSTIASSFIAIGSSVTRSVFNWGNNVAIGGSFACAGTPWCDMTQAQINTIAATMPAGDTYVSGATTAARQLNAGLLGVATNDFTCTPTPQNPCAAGANLLGIKGALGIVSNVGTLAGPGAIQFNYLAPDSRACSVDTSPDGVTWTRATDSGGSRSRSLLVGGLTASTSYRYRLMCYFSQDPILHPWFEFPSEHSNMSTEGTIATAQTGNRTLSIQFQLPAGASSVQFVATGIGGSPISQTCSSSPCGLANVPNGGVNVQASYLNGSGHVVSSGTFTSQ